MLINRRPSVTNGAFSLQIDEPTTDVRCGADQNGSDAARAQGGNLPAHAEPGGALTNSGSGDTAAGAGGCLQCSSADYGRGAVAAMFAGNAWRSFADTMSVINYTLTVNSLLQGNDH